MSPRPLDCNVVFDRLIGGERPAGDPLLAEHVGSCLTCFRIASDLKGLPQLRRQMLEAGEPAADPGAAFWASFPAQVSTAWEAKRNVEEAEAAALAAARVIPGWRERLGHVLAEAKAWLRMPGPAALGGAVCAAAIILVAARPWEGHVERGRPGALVAGSSSEGAGSSATATGTTAEGGGSSLAVLPSSGSLLPGGAMDDTLKELDVDGLWALQKGLDRTLTEDVRARPPADGDEPAQASSTALSDDLEELDDTGLVLLSKDLQGT